MIEQYILLNMYACGLLTEVIFVSVFDRNIKCFLLS